MGYTPPQLEVRKITGGYSVFPSGATTDDLTIYPNASDGYPSIELLGSAGAPGEIHMVGAPIRFYYATDNYGLFELNSGNLRLMAVLADSDICLIPTGTGRVRFGAYTAGAATDSTGYITIKDEGGTTRKLMVQA